MRGTHYILAISIHFYNLSLKPLAVVPLFSRYFKELISRTINYICKIFIEKTITKSFKIFLLYLAKITIYLIAATYCHSTTASTVALLHNYCEDFILLRLLITYDHEILIKLSSRGALAILQPLLQSIYQHNLQL